MNILIGTKNQKKIDVVTDVFKDTLQLSDITVSSHHADSGVPECPHDRETYDGAINRAEACRAIGDADYYVGIESGSVERYGHMFEEAWAVVIARDGTQRIGYSSGLLLPPVVSERMKNGEVHNDIMQYYDKKFDLPDDNRDTWSRYTGGSISRELSLREALRNAIIQLTDAKNNLYAIEASSSTDV